MFLSESEDQFKDYVLRKRLHLNTNCRNSHPVITKPKFERSPWTKKIGRNKQNEEKLNFIHAFYENKLSSLSAVQKHSIQKRPSGLEIGKQSLEKDELIQIKKSNIKSIYKQYPLKNRFVINRNVKNTDTPQDLTKSGILLQKIESEDSFYPLQPKKFHDPRLFLKSLNIKNSPNLYKGNFSKFTKKEINHSPQSKRLNWTNDMQLCPWQQGNNSRFYV